VHNEGASKGILVTTSGYGKAAYDFANGKPIELISGSNLLYLLKEHASIEARIEMPPDWVDARPDTAAMIIPESTGGRGPASPKSRLP
jgi:restriction system protein